MAEFFAELKRRHIYRVGAGYAVIAWVLAQGVDLLSQVFEIPHAFAQPAILILAAGLPVALIVAWIIESKPQEKIAGAVRSEHTVVDWALFTVVVLLVGLTGYQQIARSSGAPTQSGVEVARQVASTTANAVSIAVLPFENLSGDATQAFFSDGMTEEITAALAKVPDLKVVARTSAFQFRSQDRDIRSIGQQLNATHFIEGSVRKAGSRVRITAQLIKVDDGTHVWAENYERDLTDIFFIQEDIARTIAAALSIPLGLKPGENLVKDRSIDPDSYQQFLRAKALLRGGGAGGADAISILEPLVIRNPNYAPAWEELGLAYFFMVGGAAPGQRQTYIAKIEAAANRAVALDPNSGLGRVEQVFFKDVPRKWAIIEDAYANVLSMDPYRPDVMQYHTDILMAVGRVKDSLALKQKLMEIEPLVPSYRVQYAQALWLDGQTDAAIKIIEDLGARTQGELRDLSQYHASIGRYREAADAISRIPQTPANGELLRSAISLMRSAPAKVRAPDKLPELGRAWGFIYLYIGAPERFLESFEQAAPNPGAIGYLWHSSYAPVRKTERFKTMVRKLRLVDYWRERGWPESCHPTTGDDFACE